MSLRHRKDFGSFVAALAGSALGLCFLIELPVVVPLSATTLGLASFSNSKDVSSAIRKGALFGVFGCGVAAAWFPGLLGSLDASIAARLGGFAALVLWCGGLPWALVGLLAFGLRAAPLWLGALGIGLAVGLLDLWANTPPWGIPGFLLSYPLIRSEGVAQLAVVGGAGLVSAVGAGSAYAVARGEGARGRVRVLAVLGASWLALALGGLALAEALRGRGDAASAAPPVRALFVQPDFDHAARWQPDLQRVHLEELVGFTLDELEARTAAGRSPDVVFWPETTFTLPVDRTPAFEAALLEAVGAIGRPVVAGFVLGGRGAAEPETDRYRNVVAWLDPERGIVSVSEKAIAIPVFESAGDSLLERGLRGFTGEAGDWPRAERAPFGEPLRGDFEVGVLLCYEALFEHAGRARRGEATLALVNLADDSWIDDPRPTRQLTAFAAYRAIEQRLPFVRLAHGGLSAAFDEYGRERARLPLDRFAALEVELRPTRPPGAVERLGLLLLFVGPGAAVAALGSGASRSPAPKPIA